MFTCVAYKERLPPGSRSDFQQSTLEEAGWTDLVIGADATDHTGKAIPGPSWDIDHDGQGSLYAKATFAQSKLSFIDKAIMRSKNFSAIAYYHSLPDSKFYRTCYVSIVGTKYCKVIKHLRVVTIY